MTARPDEEFCQKASDGYLGAHFGIRGATWHSEPNGKATPPDFHMRHGGRTYSIEITTLMTQHGQAGRQKPTYELGIWRATEHLAEDVEREAAEQGLLRGVCILTLTGPYCRFQRSGKELKEALMRFIVDTKDVDEVPFPSMPSATPSGQQYFLQKGKGVGGKSLVGIAMLGDDGGWLSSIVDELSSLVQHAIAARVAKLRAVPPPRILLLHDRYYHATEREYVNIRQRLAGPASKESDLREFHSIYLIRGDSQVFCLLPVERPIWNNEG